MQVHDQFIKVPASPWSVPWEQDSFPEAPDLDAHGTDLRKEFSGNLHKTD
jgi:itaconate CoA-transferase